MFKKKSPILPPLPETDHNPKIYQKNKNPHPPPAVHRIPSCDCKRVKKSQCILKSNRNLQKCLYLPVCHPKKEKRTHQKTDSAYEMTANTIQHPLHNQSPHPKNWVKIRNNTQKICFPLFLAGFTPFLPYTHPPSASHISAHPRPIAKITKKEKITPPLPSDLPATADTRHLVDKKTTRNREW